MQQKMSLFQFLNRHGKKLCKCVILCTIFKTFDACNVCKFTIIIIITIIIIFKMGVCEAREHGDFSCYQDKRILKKHLNKIFKTRFS